MYNNLYYAIKGKFYPGGGKGSDPAFNFKDKSISCAATIKGGASDASTSKGGSVPSEHALKNKVRSIIANYNEFFKTSSGETIPSNTTLSTNALHIIKLRDELEHIAFGNFTSAEKNASLLNLYFNQVKATGYKTEANLIVDLAIELNNTISYNPTLKPFTIDLNGLRLTPNSLPLPVTVQDLTTIPEIANLSSPSGNINPSTPSVLTETVQPISSKPILRIDPNINVIPSSDIGSPSSQYSSPQSSQSSPLSGSSTPNSALPSQPSPLPLPVRSPDTKPSEEYLSWVSKTNRLKGYYGAHLSARTAENVDVTDLMNRLNRTK
jgi:hypothetical protein